MELADEKQELRRALALRRRGASRDPSPKAGERGVERAAELIGKGVGKRVAELVLATAEFRRARRVALYVAREDELPTRELFEAARGASKQLLFPRCLASGALAFAGVDCWEDLLPGRYGLLEPAGKDRGQEFDSGDLVLLPGLAFDSAGNRLGRGKGYYDRTFPSDRGEVPSLFGCAFEDQVLEQVPAGPLDRCVHAVVTEEGIRRVRDGKREKGKSE